MNDKLKAEIFDALLLEIERLLLEHSGNPLEDYKVVLGNLTKAVPQAHDTLIVELINWNRDLDKLRAKNELTQGEVRLALFRYFAKVSKIALLDPQDKFPTEKAEEIAVIAQRYAVPQLKYQRLINEQALKILSDLE